MFSFRHWHRIVRVRLSRFFAAAFLFAFAMTTWAQMSILSMRTPGTSDPSAVDAGPVPGSQPLSLTIRLAMPSDRSAALDQLLVQQATSSSSSYHHWLSSQQFGEQFGAADEEIATVTAWLQSQGLSVDSVSAGKTRILVSGTAAQVQTAFSVTLRQYQKAGAVYFANSNQPSVPQAIASLVAGVSGLDDMPAAAPVTIATVSTSGTAAVASSADQLADPLVIAASAVDANAAPILALSTNACSTDYIQSDYAAYHDLLRQANAQGMTVLATSACGVRGTGSFPASLAEATAVTVTPVTAPFVGIALRPGWQSAPGLPADTSRHETDLTTSSLSAFAQTMNTIVQQNGNRLGNINTTLYALAPAKGLYTQPDATSATVAGTWEPSTGLGVVDLSKLLKVYPRDTGAGATTISLTSSAGANSIAYGTPLTLTATVAPTVTGGTAPSGTVSFTFASSQGSSISSAPLVGGTATLTVNALNVDSYSITASYNGDANYGPSSTVSNKVTVSVVIVNANLAATIAPTANVPYGATATATATVTLPTAAATPTGPVSAQIEAAGSSFTATLSPNPGGNSATANILISVPPPGSYLVQVSCAGNLNFQCQTPVNIPITTVKGFTLVTVAVNPAAPQAGEPITLTATVNNAGNGTGAYSFTGNIIFYDNGKILAQAAVGSNQATATVTLSGTVSHTIVAAYSGDANWNASTSAGQSVTPTLLSSTVTLSSNVGASSPALTGVNTVLTATVFTATQTAIQGTGTVAFYDTYNGTVLTLGVSTLVPNGPNQSTALLSTTGLPGGANSVYAVYGGDSNFGPANSPTLALTYSDFSVTMIPQTLTISRGQNGQAVLLVGTVSGFNGSVTFGCTPPPNTETTCSFSPISVSGGGSTTMTIQTTAPVAAATTSTSAALRTQRKPEWTILTGASLAVLFCFAVPRRRRVPTLLLLLCAVGLTSGMGCGQGASGSPSASSSAPSDPGTPLGTQMFTITTAGSDGISTVRHNYQYQVTIQ